MARRRAQVEDPTAGPVEFGMIVQYLRRCGSYFEIDTNRCHWREMMQFVLNGRTVDLPAAYADDPLLYVLRDHFELNGPKFGCGAGACGACMVHVDGEARRSCQLTARDVAGHDVTSLEGLGAGRPGGLHPLQQAWVDHLVPQCGYCQNGQIMTAAALLAGNPTIGSDEIAAEMDRVLCRCGTQMRIRAAISAARDVIRRGA